MNSKMTQELNLEEVAEAIASLSKGKALGHDSLPTKVFQKNAKDTAPTLLIAFRAMLSLRLTSDFINKGNITLISKFGDQFKLGNWHLITLLGSIYKILTKFLAQRI